MTDHRHLGQILTYAAHAAASGTKVLAVWLTEETRPAHLAAVEFLNRVAGESDGFGMLLLRVRLPACNGWHVHFEVDAEPNASAPGHPDGWRQGRRPVGIRRRPRTVHREGLRASGPHPGVGGCAAPGSHHHQARRSRVQVPGTRASALATARVVSSANSTNVALYLELPTTRKNWAVAELLRQTYERLAPGYGLRVDDWHEQRPQREAGPRCVITGLPLGYDNAEPATLAKQAADIIGFGDGMLTDHPLTGTEERVAALARTTP